MSVIIGAGYVTQRVILQPNQENKEDKVTEVKTEENNKKAPSTSTYGVGTDMAAAYALGSLLVNGTTLPVWGGGHPPVLNQP